MWPLLPSLPQLPRQPAPCRLRPQRTGCARLPQRRAAAGVSLRPHSHLVSSSTSRACRTPRYVHGCSAASPFTRRGSVVLLLPSHAASGDRALVEALFEHGFVQVVCTTSTLALGVNLPVFLVVVKGTKQWRGGRGYEEISEAMLQQMIGRAGRPQFNERGMAVILTSEESVARCVRATPDTEIRERCGAAGDHRVAPHRPHRRVHQQRDRAALHHRCRLALPRRPRSPLSPSGSRALSSTSARTGTPATTTCKPRRPTRVKPSIRSCAVCSQPTCRSCRRTVSPVPLSPTDLITVTDGRFGPRLGALLMQKFYLRFATTLVVTSVYQCDSEAALLLHLAHAAVEPVLPSHAGVRGIPRQAGPEDLPQPRLRQAGPLPLPRQGALARGEGGGAADGAAGGSARGGALAAAGGGGGRSLVSLASRSPAPRCGSVAPRSSSSHTTKSLTSRPVRSSVFSLLHSPSHSLFHNPLYNPLHSLFHNPLHNPLYNPLYNPLSHCGARRGR